MQMPLNKIAKETVWPKVISEGEITQKAKKKKRDRIKLAFLARKRREAPKGKGERYPAQNILEGGMTPGVSYRSQREGCRSDLQPGGSGEMTCRPTVIPNGV